MRLAQITDDEFGEKADALIRLQANAADMNAASAAAIGTDTDGTLMGYSFLVFKAGEQWCAVMLTVDGEDGPSFTVGAFEGDE